MRFFDVSPTVRESVAVFPGDTPYTRETLLAFERGHHLALSTMRSTVHLGAHADAPSHYHPGGAAIDVRSPELYVGPCEVRRVRVPAGTRLGPEVLENKPIRAPRVLFDTGSFPDPDRWTDDFNALSPGLVDLLAAWGVKLVGIDTPSIDPHDSKALESHQAAFRHDLAVLEGLVLTGVPEGVYTLTALPLKLAGADAAPVRAILWDADLVPRRAPESK